MSRRLSALLTVLALLPFAESAFAQIDTGVIVGRVTDDSGAVLPGVTVVATQEGTGVASTTVTNERGEFIFPGLRVGVYAVAAELQGFKRAMRRDIRVSVQTRAQVDLQLNVGALAEEVIVTARTELLQTQSADIGNVVDARQVRDLPLLGRRYSELAFLSPGVVAAPAGITSRGEDTFFNANGNYATWNNYTLDGADNNSFSTNLQERSPQVVQPPVDALSEFKVQTRTYSAEFGKAAGAVINTAGSGNDFVGGSFSLGQHTLTATAFSGSNAWKLFLRTLPVLVFFKMASFLVMGVYRGLWRYTRHPNYFGDAAVWWGLTLLALHHAAGLIGLLSAALMTWLLAKGTGAALLERSIGKRRPGYAEYVRRTSGFFPLPPKKTVS